MSVISVFDEILLDPNLLSAESATGSPEFANTLIKSPPTGVYKVNINRYDPQLVLNLDINLLSATELEYFINFWYAGWGSAYGFRLHWPGDFYAIDEVFGTGDGSTTVFPLLKTYNRPGSGNASYARRIIKPVVNSRLTSGSATLYEANGSTSRLIPSTNGAALGVPVFTIKDAGSAVTGYTVHNKTGIVTFNSAPANGHALSWSGEFDTPCRFLQNNFSARVDVSSTISGLQLCEILGAELGIT